MKNFLNISDLSKTDFNQILDYSDKLNSNLDNCLKDKNIGLIFEKNSTRTRLSFQVGIKQLKGNFIDIRLEDLNLNRFESFEDTFEVMACYLDCLVIRTTSHKKLELAKKYFNKPIINALSDLSHPCQAISDIFTIKEYFGRLKDINIIWMGDINNVLMSLIETHDFLENVKIDIFTDKSIYNNYKNKFNKFDKIKFHFEINKEVLSSANCIMTDVFNSMNDKIDKEPLLKKFQVNKHIMSLLPAKSVFMHCLPAKIDSEVTSDVIKGYQSIVIQQAKNRMVAQRGILKWLEI
tara:strand:- start:462 stop:1340 length:879 start_codon:yes stop_codon:yes gene_type:complete